ncbi:hypothetical protein TruAng_004066 [Truncatella angustata]|nr:hypothetical protein TruAng_004066 [Truncatella angustata]
MENTTTRREATILGNYGVFGNFGEHKCFDTNVLAYAAAGMGIAQDVTILILPLPIIAQLNMPRRKRLLTLFMFSVGIFVVLASCFRLHYLTQFAKSLNPTWDYINLVIWTSLQVKVTVVVLCLPTVKMIFAKLIPSVFGTNQKSTTTNTFTPHSGSRSARRNKYEDLSDNAASLQTALQPWESDIELCSDVESVLSYSPTTHNDEVKTGTVAFALPTPERGWR